MLDPLLEMGLEDALEAAMEAADCADPTELLEALQDEIMLDPLVKERLMNHLNSIEL